MNFTLFKIPVFIHPSFWLILVLFTGVSNAISVTTLFYAIIIFFSLIVHELGHGLTAQKFGASPKIELHAFGGTTSYYDNFLSEKQRFFVTLNGPLFESLLIFIPYALLKLHVFQNGYINYFLYLSFRINLFWCLINLIPLYPLDGGKLFRYIMQTKFGSRGVNISVFVSIACAVIGAGYFLLNQYYMIGAIFALYGMNNFQMIYQLQKNNYKPNFYQLYTEALRSIENDELNKAKDILVKLLKTKANDYIKISATESLAVVLFKEQDFKNAYSLLLKTDHSKLKQGKCLLCKLAYNESNFSLIEKYSYDIYEIEPTQEIAILNSKAFAGLNNPELSGGWLKTALLFENVDKKYLQNLLEEEIFSSVKNNKKFQEYIALLYQ